MKKKISIVIVNWNTLDLLETQLVTLTQDNELKIVVVDNNSEKSLTHLQKKFQTVEFVINKTNRGFGAGCNQGYVLTKGEWVLFLNPDAQITPGQISSLYEYAQKHQLAAVSPQPQTDGYRKPVPSTLSLIKEFSPLRFFIPSFFFKDYTLTGGCMMINRKVFEKMKGFDERFFLWFEDSDLTRRLITKRYSYGFATVKVDHPGGVSFKKLSEQKQTALFFFAMNVYVHKHFSRTGKLFMKFIFKRYLKRKILPALNRGVSLVVPNMHIEFLQEFLSTNSFTLKSISELIVISSNFSSHTLWNYRKKYPQVRFISIDKNRGVASTIDIGFRAATTEWIGTVNDDTVLSKEWIEKCLECAQENSGALNPLIYKSDGSLESAGVKVYKKGKALPLKEIRIEKCYKVDAVNAAIVLYANNALNKTGIYDERFGSYLEDIDHSLRLSRNGFKNVVVPGARVVHVGQKTSRSLGVKKQIYDARNWWYVILKNWGVVNIVRNFPQIIIERLRNIAGIFKNV